MKNTQRPFKRKLSVLAMASAFVSATKLCSAAATAAITIFCGFIQAANAAPATVVQSVTYNGETVTMRMDLQPLRGANFELWVQNATGAYDVTTPVDERSYIGSVDEYPGAVSCGILQDDGVFRGAVYFDRGKTWFTLGNTVPSTRAQDYDTFSNFHIPSSSTVQAGQAGSTTYGYDVGIDAEYTYYSGPGGSSIAKTFELIEYSVCLTRAIYMRDVLLRPYLGRVIVRADETQDPYTVLTGSAYLGALRAEWITNHTSANRDLVAGVTTNKVGGGLAWIGVVGHSHGYSINDSSAGAFDVIWRHEMGHNWGCDHYVGGSPEGTGIMGGNAASRFSGPEVHNMLAHRDSKVSQGGILDNEGIYTAVELPPYASLDSVSFVQTADTNLMINVLANDHDANGQTITLTSADSVSAMGGTVTLLGQDLVYTAPGSYIGTDSFKYVVADTTGKTATGAVVIDVTSNNSMLAYLPLDEASGTTAANTASPTQPGSVENGGVVGVAGQFGQAVTLDGIDDRIDLNIPNLVSDTVTLSCWIKRSSTVDQVDYAGIIMNHSGGLNFGTNNELRYHWNDGSWAWDSGLIPPADQWVFVALVIEPNQTTIYMHDGASLQSAVQVVANLEKSFSGKISIGAFTNRNDRDYAGGVDDVRIFKYGLDAAEIAALIDGGSAGSPRPFDGAWGVIQPDLGWSPASNATEYRVYLGTDETAVQNATTASDEYLGATTSTSYDTPALNSRTTYYWRVDTVKASGTTTGEVWKFTLSSISTPQITNHSFEDGPTGGGAPTGWTLTSGSSIGVGVLTNGSQFLYLGPGTSITQDLNHTLETDEELTLQFEFNSDRPYTRKIQLLANNAGAYTLLAESTDTTIDPNEDWTTISLNHTVTAAHNGQKLTLRMETPNNDWNELDNFRIISAKAPSMAPTWNSTPLVKSAAVEDLAYHDSLPTDVTDPENDPLTFVKVSGPDWLQVADDGSLSGTPTTVDIGTQSWQISVSDSFNPPVLGTVNITITDSPDAPAFTTDPVMATNASQGVAYTASIANSATDADAGDTVSYTKTSGPTWLHISSDGRLSGMAGASDADLNAFTIQASDGNGGVDTATLHITVVSGIQTLFSDNFERTTGSTIGNGWIETSNNSRIYDSASAITKLVISQSAGQAITIVNPVGINFIAHESYELNWNGARATTADGTMLYDVALGTWDGATFTPLASQTGSLANVNSAGKQTGPTVNYSAGSAQAGQGIAIQLTTFAGSSDWVGFDDIVLTHHPELDSDSDGILNSWELANGLNPAINDRLLDEDGDGFNNWSEYITDTDPQSKASQQALTVDTAPSAQNLRFNSSVNRRYTIYYSEDLSANSWQALTAAETGTGSEMTIPDNAAITSKRFYRLQIDLP